MSESVVCRASRLCLAAAGALLLPALAAAQGGKLIVLEHADSLEGRTVNGEDVRELIGNVQIRQDSVRITADRALQFLSSGLVTMTGHVVVKEDSLTMRAPRGAYHKDERRAEAFDSVSLDDGHTQLTAKYGEYFVDPRRAFFRSNVRVVDTSSVITADSLTYFRIDRRSIARGRVTVENRTDRVTITGGELLHDAPRDYSKMTIDPLLVQIDTSSSGTFDTLAVRSLIMEAYRDTLRRLVATDSVRIARSDLSGTAGLAVFYTQGDSILLRRSPVVWYQRTQVSGDSMNVYLERRKLRLVRVMGDPFAISQSDSLHPERFDQMTGELMLLHFAQPGLEKIEVETHAISVYHLYEDSSGNGINRTSGDRIIMGFRDGKVQWIKVVGGVEGDYYPENMVKGRESEYAIPGFLWRTDRPDRRRLMSGGTE